VVYFREGKLVAIDAINRPADYQLVRRALARGAAVGRDAFDDSDRLPAEVLT
jgi:3-phenylpropionate/trans-cinnamate dioxygenase ferredoxin reductase subunit